MNQNINLCSFSISNFQPHYSDINENSMIYSDKRTAAQFFNDLLSSASIQETITENPKISDLENIVNQAIAFLHSDQKNKAKIFFKGFPHLYAYIDFKNDNTDLLTQLLIQVHTEFPEKSFIIYPLLVLLILKDQIESGYSFLFYHVLTIPKHLLKPSLSVFLNENSRLTEKCFILSTFLPSFEFEIPNLQRPKDYLLLPDPLQMIDYLSEFTDDQINYACHVMQISHHYLLSLAQSEELEIKTFIPLLCLIGSSSFSRGCFSLSIYITTQIPSENFYVIQFIQKIQEFGCFACIEELFLYNTTESFSHLIPYLSNIFYQFFVTNYDHLSTEMQTVLPSLCHDLNGSSAFLNELSIQSGNRVYLYWLYIFLTRLTSESESDDVKIEIVRENWSLIHMHIEKVTLLIKSAENFIDPSIDFLLISTLYSIFNYLSFIVKEGTISDSFVDEIYDFTCQSIHFIISTAIIVNKVTSLGCELLKTYSSVKKLLLKQPLFFKKCVLTFSEVDEFETPIIALALSNINTPISFISKLANILIKANETTCFYCLSSLINNCKKLNELSIFFIQFFHDLIFLKDHRNSILQQNILTRYFLLLCSTIIDNERFARIFVTCPHFDAFDHLLRKLIGQTVIVKEAVELQESIVFFLWSLYRSFINDDQFHFFEPFPVEIFQKSIEYFTQNGATVLLETTINFLKVHQFKNVPFTIHWNNINHSQALNIDWFADFIKNFNKNGVGQIERSNLNQSFSLPWKQNRVYSELLSLVNWRVEFQKITLENTF